jgi:hypothetical protein
MTEPQAPLPPLPPGIYFDLPALRHHLDPALGSSDIRLLHKSPRRFWYASAFNPDPRSRARYNRSSDAMSAGSALHTLTLEGRAAFDRCFVRRPDDQPGATSGDKAKVTKAVKARLMAHQTMLATRDYDLAVDTFALIDGHPDLTGTLAGGAREVTVIWERIDKVRCKARFDLLKPEGMADIKSIENETDMPLDVAAHLAIKRQRIDLQIEHYFEGRRALPALVDDGAIFTWSDHHIERSMSSALPEAEAHFQMACNCVAERDYAFLLIFVQKSFPAVWATVFQPGNAKMKQAREVIEQAIGAYKMNLAKHGPDRPWSDSWRLHEYDWANSPGGKFGWD